MTFVPAPPDDARIEPDLAGLRALISSRYPEAAFTIERGDDPEGVYLVVTVDIDDPDDLIDLIIESLMRLQIDEALPIYVLPVRPLASALASMRTARQPLPAAPVVHWGATA